MSSNVANSDAEEMAIITSLGIIVPIVLGAVGVWLTTQSTRAITWLLAHKVLVTPEDALIPIGDKAGLDLLRIITLLALISTVAFAAVRFKPRRTKRVQL